MARHLRGIDAAWRRMDRDPQQAVITALMRFDGPIELDALETSVARAIAAHEPFRMRVVDRGIRGVVFEEDPLFDLKNHVRRLPPAFDERELADVVSELASEPLNEHRPLWDLHVSGDAVVARIHHCIADGVALVRVLLGATDAGLTLDPESVGWSKPARRLHLDEATTLAKTLLLPRDPPSILRGPLGARKRVAWTAPFPVSRAKQIARAVNGHLNDALVAALAGGIAEYAETHGRALDREIRAMVPIFVHGGHEPAALGNAFGLVFLQLPTSLSDPLARLREARRRMEAIKNSPETSNAVSVLGLLGRVTPSIERCALQLFTEKASLVFTNVPGPPGEVSIAGRGLRSIAVWAPYAGDLALSITAVSYDGMIRMGVLANEDVVAQPEELADAIDHALQDLEFAVSSLDQRSSLFGP